MRPIDLQPIGNELAIKWDDGTESYIPLKRLRECCPCAGCKGERDVMGNLHKGPDQPYAVGAFYLKSIAPVGGYGVQPVWADGHATGIYPFDYLKQIAAS